MRFVIRNSSRVWCTVLPTYSLVVLDLGWVALF